MGAPFALSGPMLNGNESKLQLTRRKSEMKYSDAFPSKYMRADDLQGVDRIVTIASVDFEDFTDPKTRRTETKPLSVISAGRPQTPASVFFYQPTAL
jgi:hypothetical protein